MSNRSKYLIPDSNRDESKQKIFFTEPKGSYLTTKENEKAGYLNSSQNSVKLSIDQRNHNLSSTFQKKPNLSKISIDLNVNSNGHIPYISTERKRNSVAHYKLQDKIFTSEEECFSRIRTNYEKEKKIKKLFAQIENIKPINNREIAAKQVNYDKFLRKSMINNKIPKQTNHVLKNKDYIYVKSKYHDNLGNERKIFSARAAYNIVYKCSKQLNKNPNIDKINKLSENSSKQVNKILQKSSRGLDYYADKTLIKEGLEDHKRQGHFMYGNNNGYHHINFDRLHGPQYDIRAILKGAD